MKILNQPVVKYLKQKSKIELLLLVSTLILIVPTILSLLNLIGLFKEIVTEDGFLLYFFGIFIALYVFALVLSFFVRRSLSRREDLPEEFREKYKKSLYSFGGKLDFISSFLILFNILFGLTKVDKFYLLWSVFYITGVELLLLASFLNGFQKRKVKKERLKMNKRIAWLCGVVAAFLLLLAGFTVYRAFYKYSLSQPLDTLTYQSKTYYGTALIEPALDSKTEEMKLLSAHQLPAADKKQGQLWSVSGLSQEKLIVSLSKKTGMETWTSEKLDSPSQAMDFLKPQYIFYNTNDSPKLTGLSPKKQEQLISALKELMKTKAKFSFRMPPEDNMQDFREIYLYKDKTWGLFMQVSLVKKHNIVDVYFSGDQKMEYWQASQKLLDLLK